MTAEGRRGAAVVLAAFLLDHVCDFEKYLIPEVLSVIFIYQIEVRGTLVSKNCPE